MSTEPVDVLCAHRVQPLAPLLRKWASSKICPERSFALSFTDCTLKRCSWFSPPRPLPLALGNLFSSTFVPCSCRSYTLVNLSITFTPSTFYPCTCSWRSYLYMNGKLVDIKRTIKLEDDIFNPKKRYFAIALTCKLDNTIGVSVFTNFSPKFGQKMTDVGNHHTCIEDIIEDWLKVINISISAKFES